MNLEPLVRAHAFMNVEHPPNGAVFAYTRNLAPEGSVRTLFPRLDPAS